MSTPRKTFYWARANATRQAPTAVTSMMRSLGISSALRVPGRRYANFRDPYAQSSEDLPSETVWSFSRHLGE